MDSHEGGLTPLQRCSRCILQPQPTRQSSSGSWGPFWAQQLQLLLLRPFCSAIFSVFWQSLNICLSFCFLLFPFCRSPEKQNPQDVNFSFLLNNIRSSLSDGIRWPSASPENFINFFLKNKFWFLQIPFGRMVNCHSLAQFPADYLSCPVVSTSLIHSS